MFYSQNLSVDNFSCVTSRNQKRFLNFVIQIVRAAITTAVDNNPSFAILEIVEGPEKLP